MSSTSLDESSLDGSSNLKANKESCCDKSESLVMDDVIVKFMAVNKGENWSRMNDFNSSLTLCMIWHLFFRKGRRTNPST